MDVSSIGRNTTQTDQHPLLMEHNNHEHILDITSNDDDSSIDEHQDEERISSNGTQHHVSLAQQRATSSRRVDDGNGRPSSSSSSSRSPLNSGIWISVELLVTVAQIVAALVVMVLAKDEHPEAPLFTWVVGYTSGCVATLPILYWRFRTYNRGTGQDGTSTQGNNNPSESTPYTPVSVAQMPDEENNTDMTAAPRNNQVGDSLRTRLNGLVDHFKMAIDCFFAVWFVVGNVWIFGGHSSPSDSPKLYRLCIAFLTFSCIGYAMPFILCATICCCLPCLISVLGFRENFSQTRGATAEAINACLSTNSNQKAEMIWKFQRKVKVDFFCWGLRRNVLYQAKMPAVASAWLEMETAKKLESCHAYMSFM